MVTEYVFIHREIVSLELARRIVMAMNPSIQKLVGVFRLVVRDHVSSFVDAQETQIPSGSELPCWAASCFRDPFVVFCCVEFFLAFPFEREGPRLVAVPVADEISVAGVDQHTHTAFKQRRDVMHVGLH